MAVGVFWTRLGTPTTDAESGTAEEIDRVGGSGKPVMLYFSRSKMDPELIDFDEYSRLKKFKDRSYPEGLVEHYSSLNDLREKFRRQLAIRINDFIARDAPRQGEKAPSTHDMTLAIAEDEPLAVLSPAKITLNRTVCVDQNTIPDYTEYDPDTDEDYYRDIVRYHCERDITKSLRLAIVSEHGIRDLYMMVKVYAIGTSIAISPSAIKDDNILRSLSKRSPGHLTVESASPDEWRMEVTIPVLQAQRIIFSANPFLLKVTGDSTVVFEATVYSSDTPPFSSSTELDVHVEPLSMSYREILKKILPKYDEAN